MDETEISTLYNFNYNCTYNDITNKEEKKVQYQYDLSQIISKTDNEDLYIMKLYGIFVILNNNEITKYIFNLLRKKMPIEFHEENNFYYNVRLFYQILSIDFLHFYHTCLCDIYHNNIIKIEHLNKLVAFINSLTLTI